MRIAQVAPLMESVPPRLYGGTERIVSYLTEELVAQGHDITLFASGDSQTSARLVPCSREALRFDATIQDVTTYYMLMLDQVRRQAGRFDIIHFHISQFQFPIFRDIADKTVTTLHGRQDLPDLPLLYAGFPEMTLIAISENQRSYVSGATFAGTIHHGLPRDLLLPTFVPRGGYLAFIGRISPEKRVDRAIRIANAVGMQLKIAAKVDRVDEAYFNQEIAPMLDTPGVEFIGEISERDKSRFLGEARGLLFPIDWPEPFGLVMIEAMACGTPVLAFRNGSASEVIDEGVTGFLVESEDEAVRKIGALVSLDRSAIRRRFDERFTADRMACEHVELYRRLTTPSELERLAARRPSSIQLDSAHAS